jgi:uncharacterized protein (UPF0335 family)
VLSAKTAPVGRVAAGQLLAFAEKFQNLIKNKKKIFSKILKILGIKSLY